MSTDLGRVLFMGAWIVVQGVLVATGGQRSDGAFAFRMFPESSMIEIEIFRDIEAPSGHGTVRVPIDDATWLARDARGTLHRFRWDDRVKDASLYPYGTPIHASYGAEAQVERLARALEDVATHIPDDAETKRLAARVIVRKNGRPAEERTLESALRAD